MREKWNFTHDGSPASYLNPIAFAARLTSATRGENHAIDFSFDARGDFSTSLEQNRQQFDEMGLHCDLEDLLTGLVRWLELCGLVLAALAAEQPQDDGADFSVPRWTRWRERLAVLRPGAGTGSRDGEARIVLNADSNIIDQI